MACDSVASVKASGTGINALFKPIAPILKKVIENNEAEIALAKLEVDEGKNMKIAGQYQVRGFPTILFIQNGEEKARFSGAQSESFIENPKTSGNPPETHLILEKTLGATPEETLLLLGPTEEDRPEYEARRAELIETLKLPGIPGEEDDRLEARAEIRQFNIEQAQKRLAAHSAGAIPDPISSQREMSETAKRAEEAKNPYWQNPWTPPETWDAQ